MGQFFYIKAGNWFEEGYYGLYKGFSLAENSDFWR